ncbi:MAG: DUF1320 domain-containing protein [Myxococcota bacterium]
MAYATQQEYTTRFGGQHVEVSADLNDDCSPDGDAITAALDDACSIIDSYIGKRYATPLADPAPNVIKRLTLEIADYYLSKDMGPYTEEKRQRYDDAMMFLCKVSKGELCIAGATMLPNTRVQYTTDTRQLTRDKFQGC